MVISLGSSGNIPSHLILNWQRLLSLTRSSGRNVLDCFRCLLFSRHFSRNFSAETGHFIFFKNHFLNRALQASGSSLLCFLEYSLCCFLRFSLLASQYRFDFALKTSGLFLYTDFLLHFTEQYICVLSLYRLGLNSF